MTENNDNKSMFLYTALIFIVALLLIIFSFLGQSNMQKSQPQIADSTEKGMSISEKASILSEENTALIENNSLLKNENKNLSEYKKQNDLLLSANGYFISDNFIKALEILESVNYDSLTSDQQIVYNNIINNIN